MDVTSLLQKLYLVEIWRLLMIISIVIIIAVFSQCFLLPYKKISPLSPADEGSVSIALLISNATISDHSFRLNLSPNYNLSSVVSNGSYSSPMDEEIGDENVTKEPMDPTLGKGLIMGHGVSKDGNFPQAIAGENEHEAGSALTFEGVRDRDGVVSFVLPLFPSKDGENMDVESGTSNPFMPANVTSADNITEIVNIQFGKSLVFTSSLKRTERVPSLISEMNSLLLKSHGSSDHYVRPRWSSVRDSALLSAKVKIENAPVVRNYPGLHGPAFRNLSMFKRSYELMERVFRIYIYKEGKKPIFHQSKMRGIYASEGWFMKLLEGNKKFVVRDPRKAHLFYLPFSPQMLRTVLFGKKLHSQKDLERYLKNYVDLVLRKYSFWNRTGGADHFLVGCHDWAARITRQHMKNCIRVLCNANVGKGFKIGKDTTLPVTYIRSAENPLNDLGGKPPSERSILAFFAGGMHGYLRPILLQYWENKEPDMKILGPMRRDIEGKRLYREYMKSSKYCICARGYEVHTPRIVEAIMNDCVPVIISDNYVPPFFEVLNWEAFSVFVKESDVPNLRNILLSISDEKYIAMQSSVKMVQKHFLWHKVPLKYDLFHMILHSVWYNRIFQMQR